MEQIGRPMGLSAEAVRRCLDPVAGVAARSVFGGPSPALVTGRAAQQQKALCVSQEQVALRRRALAAARTTLKQELAALAAWRA
jgi:argininosuccinate lyase